MKLKKGMNRNFTWLFSNLLKLALTSTYIILSITYCLLHMNSMCPVFTEIMFVGNMVVEEISPNWIHTPHEYIPEFSDDTESSFLLCVDFAGGPSFSCSKLEKLFNNKKSKNFLGPTMCGGKHTPFHFS